MRNFKRLNHENVELSSRSSGGKVLSVDRPDDTPVAANQARLTVTQLLLLLLLLLHNILSGKPMDAVSLSTWRPLLSSPPTHPASPRCVAKTSRNTQYPWLHKAASCVSCVWFVTLPPKVNIVFTTESLCQGVSSLPSSAP